MSTQPSKIWEKREGETAKAFEAFTAYRDLGPSRSLSKAAEVYYGRSGASLGHLERWSSEHEWVRRSAAYDAHLDQQRLEVIEQTRKDAQRVISEAALQVALKLVEGSLTGDLTGPQMSAIKHALDLAGLDVVERREVTISDSEILAILGVGDD